MTAPSWLAGVPRAGDGDRAVGVLGDWNGVRVSDYVDAYEVRVGSDETIRAGYIGAVTMSASSVEHPGHLVRIARMQMAMQILADLNVRVVTMGALVRLEAGP